MSFFLAHPVSEKVPRIVTRKLAASQTFAFGALLLVDGSGNFAECGADPASIAAVAMAPAGTDSSGFNILASFSFPVGYMQAVAIANNVPFLAKYTGSLPANDGGQYGVVKDTDGFWKVDFGETTAKRLQLVDRRTAAPESLGYVEVLFLDANVQLV